MTIHVKRIYENAGEDGFRILVDRLWPRGISKERASLDLWLKEIGPSAALRKSFHRGDIHFQEFKARYDQELNSGKQREAYEKLKQIAMSKENVTLLFAAKDETHNQAQVLKEKLEKDLHQRSADEFA